MPMLARAATLAVALAASPAFAQTTIASDAERAERRAARDLESARKSVP